MTTQANGGTGSPASIDPTVFVVDNDADVRTSISHLMRCVGIKVETFSSAASFLERYSTEIPGCLVLDVLLPEMSGLELQRHLKDRQINIPIIMLSARDELSTISEAMRQGAVDVVHKPYSDQLLLERINEALHRDAESRKRQCACRDFTGKLTRLSSREREILHHLANGRNSKQIATQLGISSKTVDNHRASILKKMEVDGLIQLAGDLTRFEVLDHANTNGMRHGWRFVQN